MNMYNNIIGLFDSVNGSNCIWVTNKFVLQQPTEFSWFTVVVKPDIIIIIYAFKYNNISRKRISRPLYLPIVFDSKVRRLYI